MTKGHWHCLVNIEQKEAVTLYTTSRRVKEGMSGWVWVIMRHRLGCHGYPKLLSSVKPPFPSTPAPAEKVIVPGCSDNCWNNNSEINGFYVPSETHFWTAEIRFRDWSCQLLHPVPLILPVASRIYADLYPMYLSEDRYILCEVSVVIVGLRNNFKQVLQTTRPIAQHWLLLSNGTQTAVSWV